MIHLTPPDAVWLKKLLVIAKYIQQEYPELFTEEDDETLLVTEQLIKDLNA